MRLIQITTNEFFNYWLKQIERNKSTAALVITLDGGKTSMPLLNLLNVEDDIGFPLYHIHLSQDLGIPDIITDKLHPVDLPALYIYEDGEIKYSMVATPETYHQVILMLFRMEPKNHLRRCLA